MADQTGGPTDPTDRDEIDVGEPVSQLTDLQQAPSPGFLDAIRRRIWRRHFVADAGELWWSGLAYIVLEFVKLCTQLFQPAADTQGDSDGRND